MYLRIGTRMRKFNEANASVSYAPVYDNRKQAIYVDETWNITGRLVLQEDASQANMTLAINQLARDLEQPRPDLQFLEDDGYTPSAFRLLAANCLEGPNLISAEFPSGGNDVYATGVAYSAQFQARKAIARNDAITEFSEQLSNPTGGQVEGYVGGAINLPERQVFKQSEPYTYTQSGRAVGLYGYPIPPLPLWPAWQLRRNKPVYLSPRISFPIPMEFEVQWEYNFGSEFPLIGTPHILL